MRRWLRCRGWEIALVLLATAAFTLLGVTTVTGVTFGDGDHRPPGLSGWWEDVTTVSEAERATQFWDTPVTTDDPIDGDRSSSAWRAFRGTSELEAALLVLAGTAGLAGCVLLAIRSDRDALPPPRVRRSGRGRRAEQSIRL
ncbi:hypothetical protein [Actinotalea sp. C106]|uniref:hypothetical protein n=1 Tax=Actinotalea sp. C106 TaxID=2908644 RepID=UPI00202930C9|nr:hypothetical protein [Actinotalea sp. C106]